ncbi:MAG: 5,10-methylenetetrahydrofolate reductase / Homolog of homocysteine-binding domain [uncultured Thermomicrobiales bacterium]|uniref:5,10-methylenetetrahydrofolate reductase / Homolog of homocysteine-binding domain n=1 Tax=uncultured Thermomicrobiales bacterium TaxID=1645740 RepID=A0A6J4UHL5_9BACT|nr:MAG: 5,10-methylenetetrahydrofolate reductase / Homolog of homocysteine-binding domain [uncultured Thermomicrobiales bacterium]
MAQPLTARLAERVTLADGAMGTMLYAAGIGLDECFDALNLSRPEIVAGVHRAYLAAGAEVLETNTFGANRFKLEHFGLSAKVRDINRRGAKLAREEREVAGLPALIGGSIGPTGRTLPPFGTTSVDEVRAAYREQIEALLEGGVDFLSIETIGALEEMVAAVQAARDVSDLPIVALMTFAEDGRTLNGTEPVMVVDALVELGVEVFGANCSVGPRGILRVAREMRRRLDECGHRDVALACMPNAGWPTHVGGRVIYPSSPEYFGGFATQALEVGVRLIGGCCGTTPEHIRAMRRALDAMPTSRGAAAPATGLAPVPAATPIPTKPAIELVATDGPTEIATKLGRDFVVSVEIDPPKGFNPAKALEGARLLKAAGVDAINVADSPMARVRMSALTLCYLIQHQVGIETILHFTTRDRSLMGLQSELLGAHAVGVRNILALTGDPPSLGDYPDSSAVYDVDSIGLVRVLGRLNAGQDSAGASIGRLANFTIACAVDPTREDLAEEARRLRAKLAAGADFVMTQPIYDVSVWHRFLEIYAGEIPVPVLVGILPLQSSKHAEFLHNEVPGITLTDDARDRMRRAGANGRREGVKMAQQLLTDLRPHAQGVYIMPSFGRYEVAAEVMEALG